MISHIELLQRLNLTKIADLAAKRAYENREKKIWEQDLESSPHGETWHTSFHASSFPGNPDTACARRALYGLLNIPNIQPIAGPMRAIMDAGKALEIEYVTRWDEDGVLLSRPPSDKYQTGFKDKRFWLTGNLDAIIRPQGWNRGHVVEIKGKDHQVIDEMRAGNRSYDPKHFLQLQCYLGFCHDDYLRIYRDWAFRILDITNSKEIDQYVVDQGLTEPIETGSILYVSRQRPRHTHEFFVNFDPQVWKTGTENLEQWKNDFISGNLPQRYPWKWLEEPCRYCEVKKLCKADHKAGITKLEDSTANDFAKNLRPKHDYKTIYQKVLERWS